MPREGSFKELKVIVKSIEEMFNALNEVSESVERELTRPILDPIKEALSDKLLRDYLYNFPQYPQKNLKELEEEIKRAMGVEDDFKGYVKKLIENTSGNSGEP